MTKASAPGSFDGYAHLSDKAAAVIGGASGIGEAVTLALAGAGVDVAVCDVNADATEHIAAAVTARQQRVVAQVCDAADPKQLASFFDAADDLGRLDIVVNVVGEAARRQFMGSTPQQWTADLDRNFGYVLHSTQHAVPRIRRGGTGGSIINFTSIEAHRGAATFAVYASAKAALANFTRAIAVELAGEHIRVNAIAPDTTPSEGNLKALPADMVAEMMSAPDIMEQAMQMYIPSRTPPAATDIANAVLFLASDLSTAITGTTLHVDGGTFSASGMIRWPMGVGFMPAPPPSVLRRMPTDPITSP